MTAEPYYVDEFVQLFHGDCREILPTLSSVDLLLTDPPYGIAATWKGGRGHGWGNAHAQSTLRNEWDSEVPTMETIQSAIDLAADSIIWGGNYFPLPPARGWLVWNKPERNFSLAEAELAWTTRDNVIRVKDLPRSEPDRKHPTQKPLSLMRWCITMFPKAQTVLDPFAGSGTTLRAAKDMGIACVGIEREEAYCEIAARRLDQGVLDFGSAS